MVNLFKTCLALMALFLSLPVFSQETDLEKDTIQMKEVEIVKKGKKLKIKTLELDGPCYYAENMHQAEEIITLADKLPEGMLQSVSFYFNDIYTSRKQTGKFKDAEFELVLYNANADGTPGNSIAHEAMTITVARTFSGRLSIDLYPLAIESPGRLFVGLRRITPALADDAFFIDCVCSGLDRYITMVRPDATSPWERRWQCAALRAEVSVALPR